MDSQSGISSNERGETQCVAGVLIGGRSRRMGRAKALLPHPIGGTLLEHTVHVAHEVTGEVFLLGQFESLPPALADLTRLPDAREDHASTEGLESSAGLGPLAGLCSLLGVAGDRWALLLPCDMPNVSVSLLTRLLVRASDAVDAVAYVREGRADGYHACCALYHPRLLPAVLDELEGSGRSLQALLDRSRVKAIQPNGEDRLMLTNVNTPGDYERVHVFGRSK